MPSNSKKKKTGYMYYLSKGTDNPKIFAKLTADGRESLYLEYYFGHKEVFDEKLGQTVVKKDRRKESLKLYLWQAPDLSHRRHLTRHPHQNRRKTNRPPLRKRLTKTFSTREIWETVKVF